MMFKNKLARRPLNERVVVEGGIGANSTYLRLSNHVKSTTKRDIVPDFHHFRVLDVGIGRDLDVVTA